MSVSALLVQNGIFPMSPTRPRTGVSIDLLEIYRALFERSCDAITALSAALHTIYDRRGFYVMSSKNPGQLAKDPFRTGLQQAVQWYSNLQSRLQVKVDAALQAAEISLFPPTRASIDGDEQLSSESTSPDVPTLTPGRANRILRERCPACFSLESWGRSLKDGGDVHLAADGCFSYRHSRRAGDGPISYDPCHFLSKEKVDGIRSRIANARKKQPAKCKPPIPVEIIDACRASWDAANEKQKKVDPKFHDATGLFVVTCRHSQVLFLCNIDTPGEGQQYIVALLEEVNRLLPPQATILQTYDVGCVTDHSFNLHPILSDGFRERVAFALNAMHSFKHQWICQIFYGPRFRPGMGLTDGEGVERLWSRIRKLIPITRHQWNSRRIWMIDHYIVFVNEDGRDNLAEWILRQRDTNLLNKYNTASRALRNCSVPVHELRREWEDQKAAQTSIRAFAPVRLKRELDKVLALQKHIEEVERSIEDAKKSFATSDAGADSLALLRGLQRTHETLSNQAEELYSSLNVRDMFPQLQGLPLEFVRTLLVMRELKISIRARAVGSFQEWDRLRSAVKGKGVSIGTKLHQATRKAISKRHPAIMRSIAKFNEYCVKLEELRPEGCNIPIPSPLSTQLNGHRDDPTLYEDVWITPTTGNIPRWLDDSDVRDGIRNLHVVDRCREEEARIQLECTSMVNWLTRELEIVAAAIESSTDLVLELPLQRRQRHIQYLSIAWLPIVGHKIPLRIPPRTNNVVADVTDGHTQPPTDTSAAPTDMSITLTDTSAAAPVPTLMGQTITLDTSDELFEMTSDTMEDLNSGNPFTRTVVTHSGRPNLQIEVADQERVSSPTGRLNGFGLNALAASFLGIFTGLHAPEAELANRCAVFSTYDLPRIRYKASDEELWQNTQYLEFWNKSIWLVPIHRSTQEHWVLAAVNIAQQELFFFDSLGQRSGWRQDLQDVMLLITRLTVLSNRHKHPLYVSTEEEPWVARPLFRGTPLQSNGHDCGLWVLCTMAAILRGYHVSGITEREMGSVRHAFTNHILTLSIT
ncbi:hypothetical protein B0H12DRAFT_1312933 [Mycena haematopus]|nr:hypothetical protein B0H12DRAFT_1276668 [Mycena haematopus]KAJ7242171.1 hypothetical protein B0H12DRAFT_1312933 [Mycena haematopus]